MLCYTISATLLWCWRGEPCVPVVCDVRLLLLRASREHGSPAPPRPACLYSFFVSCRRPPLVDAPPRYCGVILLTLMDSVEAGCCRAAPRFQLHQIFLIVVCNFFILELSRSNELVGHYTAPFWRDPHVHAREPYPPRLSAIRLESLRGEAAHGASDRKARSPLGRYLLHFEQVGPKRASACTVCSCV